MLFHVSDYPSRDWFKLSSPGWLERNYFVLCSSCSWNPACRDQRPAPQCLSLLLWWAHCFSECDKKLVIPPKLPARHADPTLSSLPITKEDGKRALVSLPELFIKKKGSTLQWKWATPDPIHLRLMPLLGVCVTLWLFSMSMQSASMWYIVLWPSVQNQTRAGRACFGCVGAARLPSGCLSSALSVNQHTTTASSSPVHLNFCLIFFFFNFCFSQAAGSCCDSILSCPLSISVTCLMKCVESDLPWPVHDMLKKMLILSYLAAAFRNATVSLRGLTSTLARCQNYQPLPCKCTHSCDITVCVWSMLQLNKGMRAEGK